MYALRAAVDLALHAPGGRPASTAEIARRTGAPQKFLEAILGQLRRAGLVESHRGAAGGHRLARAPARVSAAEVRRAVDGPVELGPRPPRRRSPAGPSVRSVEGLFEQVEDAVEQVLGGTSLEELARRAAEAANVHDFSI